MIENADKENSFLRLGDMISYEEEYVGLVSKICKEGIRYQNNRLYARWRIEIIDRSNRIRDILCTEKDFYNRGYKKIFS